MEITYLDNSATTKPCQSAIKKVNHMLCDNWGNPSSLHSYGIEAEKEITAARRTVADFLRCDEREIYFTPSGTIANNIAVMGAAKALRRRGNTIVTTEVEHPSVYETVKSLESDGFNVVRIRPENGEITAGQIENAVTSDTILVSMMMVNNEMGTVFPVDKVKKIIDAKGSPALFHIDAVQAFGKIPVNPRSVGAQLVTVSGHKIHAPKGVAALYVAQKSRIAPYIFGGGQERGICPGTESCLIPAMGAAIEEIGSLQENLDRVKSLRDRLTESLGRLEGIFFNSGDDCLPYVVNISVEGIRSETLLHFLAESGIYVSSGSACSKGKKSRVLTAYGLPAKRVDSALRISFCRYNTADDVDRLAAGIEKAIKTLRR
ncbi:MAG: cysteine desulfurase [Clostridia bacterium]|nr:cysteine desulfurase [Clostridia bacterium]